MRNELRRTAYRYDGVFGVFTFEGDIAPFMVTLEHGYENGAEVCMPKLPKGEYKCVRGVHQLHDGKPFETFEITGVEGHSGILFHAGNFNRDSEGCVLCGRQVVSQPDGSKMITGSRDKFTDFMQRLTGINEFILEVK